jgi:mannose-6-phosphate isomerase
LAEERGRPPARAPELVVSERPWGRFTQYCLNEPTTVKIIEVGAGCELSLQRHRHRAELWIPLDPTLQVEVDGRVWRPAVEEPVWIPAGSTHRLSAPDERGGRVLEVGFGHFDEDDIERLSDRYGRA